MTLKDQINKLKDNWLLVLIVVVILGVLLFKGDVDTYKSVSYSRGAYPSPSPMMADVEMTGVGGYYPQAGGDFAPEVEERLRVKRATLRTEVDTGEFKEAEAKLKSIITASEAFLLDETVNRYGTDKHPYRVGNYRIKVETAKYDAVTAQLKDIGDIEYFTENIEDVTERHTDLKTTLAAEKERLARYEAMYAEAKEIEDKIKLSDRIFNQERTIKYYEDRIDSIEKQVSYSSIYVTLSEEQSGYAEIVFVTLSELVTGFVDSLSSLLAFIFWILPWAVGVAILWFGYKKLAKKRR